MAKKDLACPECRHIVEVQTGNPGWWLKSNNEMKAKNKKALAILAFATANGRDPDEKERKAWEKENKDDMEKVKVPEPACPFHPETKLSADWQGFTILLDTSRSEVARALGIDKSGNYALKVRHQ
jgi:RNA polymerase subunit RPABC4/transcription elongation factor Spt4